MMKNVSVDDIIAQVSAKMTRKNLVIAAGCAIAAGTVATVAAIVHNRREREVPVLIFPVGVSVDDCDFMPGHDHNDESASDSK